MYNVLVCDDEKDIVSALKIYLTSEGYQVFEAYNGRKALEIMNRETVHLVLMDIMMPEMDGIQAMVKIREFSNVPVILLTAKSEDTDKILGLTVGADDYITKPFGVLELAARVRSLLRRAEKGSTTDAGQGQQYGKLRIDQAVREVYMDGNKIVLTYKEYELLLYLIENRMRVVPREELLDKLWDYNADIETRTLDIHIRTLRQKLGEEGGGYIRTVRSVGYRFVAP